VFNYVGKNFLAFSWMCNDTSWTLFCTDLNQHTYHASLDRPMPYRSGLKQHWGAKVLFSIFYCPSMSCSSLNYCPI